MVISTIHYKPHTCSNLTELTYNEFISIPRIEMYDMTFKVNITEIRKFTNYDIRIFDCRLYISYLIAILHWINIIRIWFPCIYIFIFNHRLFCCLLFQ